MDVVSALAGPMRDLTQRHPPEGELVGTSQCLARPTGWPMDIAKESVAPV